MIILEIFSKWLAECFDLLLLNDFSNRKVTRIKPPTRKQNPEPVTDANWRVESHKFYKNLGFEQSACPFTKILNQFLPSGHLDKSIFTHIALFIGAIWLFNSRQAKCIGPSAKCSHFTHRSFTGRLHASQHSSMASFVPQFLQQSMRIK